MPIAVHRRGAYGPGHVWYVQRANDLYPSTVYTHIPHSTIPISEITPFGPLCKIPKSPLKQFFWSKQSIYIHYIKTNIWQF